MSKISSYNPSKLFPKLPKAFGSVRRQNDANIHSILHTPQNDANIHSIPYTPQNHRFDLVKESVVKIQEKLSFSQRNKYKCIFV